MNEIVEERAVKLGEYIVAHKSTVRAAAKKFGISKSTVHTEVTKRNVLRLWSINSLKPQKYR